MSMIHRQEKAQIGNESGADYFISLHRNAAPYPNKYNGVETLVYNTSGIAYEMAENVDAELAKIGFENLGVEERKNLACSAPDNDAGNSDRDWIY